MSPLNDILLAAARVAQANAPVDLDPQTLARERPGLLLELLQKFPQARAEVRDALPDTSSDLAVLLLHTDDTVVRAAVRRVGSGPAEEKTKHLRRRSEDLRKRLDTANGRLNQARNELEQVRDDLAQSREELAERHGQLDSMRAQLDIALGRLRDPVVNASALFTTLATPESGAESRDVRTGGRPDGRARLVMAAKAAGVPAEAILQALQAMIEPSRPEPPSAARTAPLGLRVTPLGGDTEIGGSCLLVEAGGTRLLIDAGTRPGDVPRPPRDVHKAIAGAPIDAVIVTHGHNDHCGYVPALAERNSRMRILATRETVRLMPFMWADSAQLMKDRAWQARQWGDSRPALYDIQQVRATARRCEELPFGAPVRIGELTVELFPSGHILGAAGVVVRAGDQRVVVTGDISGFRQESVDGYDLPESARGADLLVLESTCCHEEHASREAGAAELVRSVEEVYGRGGRVLIPAFALGRAQELALLLARELPHVPVLVDGLARDIARQYESVSEGTDRPLEVFGKNVRPANRPHDFSVFRRGVVIAPSGMLTGGPAVGWAERILPEPENALFLCGYQDAESIGASLLDTARNGGGHLDLPNNGRKVRVPVHATVAMHRLSAHADRRGLLEIVAEADPDHVMLVHGRASRQRDFRGMLRTTNRRTAETAAWAIA